MMMANERMLRWAGVGAATALLAVTAAGAQTGGSSGAAVIDAVKGCRAIAAADQRLACFDKATAALDSAIQTHEITVMDKQEVRRTRRSLFGFSVPDIPLFGGGSSKTDSAAEATEVTELDTLVTAIKPVSYGKFDITTTEGAIWRNSDEIDFPPKPGSKVHIKKGAIGNYFLRFDGGKAVRGSRVR